MQHQQCDPDREEAISQAIARLIASNMLPISIVETEGFCSFMKCLEPGYRVPWAKTIKARIDLL